MKTIKTLFLFFASCSVGFAQDIPVEELPTATLNEGFFLTLTTDTPISNYYYVDISDMEFENESDAIKQCGYYLTANLISTEVHYADNYLIVHIYTEFMGDDTSHEKVQTYLNRLSKPN